MRDSINVSIIFQVVSLKITLFYICMIIVNEFKKLYKGNGRVIRIGHWFDLDIV